jgi:hypothetical protein
MYAAWSMVYGARPLHMHMLGGGWHCYHMCGCVCVASLGHVRAALLLIRLHRHGRDAQVDVAGQIAVASPLSSFCRLQVAAVPFARVVWASLVLDKFYITQVRTR